jgi:hypothetical protein
MWMGRQMIYEDYDIDEIGRDEIDERNYSCGRRKNKC